VIEIGAGSGIATRELAELAGEVTAIEPGRNLVAILKDQVQEYNNVEAIGDLFENFTSNKKYEAVVAFTAFHWLDKSNRYEKVYDFLNEDGNFILVWNSFFQSRSDVAAEVNKISGELLPGLYSSDSGISEINEKVLSKLRKREQEVFESSLFVPVFQKRYLVSYNYDHITYPQLLNTFPQIIDLEPKEKDNFLSSISETIKKFGIISVPVLTTLVVCKKREGLLKFVSETNR